MKKQLAMTSAMATALLALPACSARDDWSDEPRAYADTAICTDRDGRRVEDHRCYEGRSGGGMSNGFLWYYLGRNSAVPYYGDSVRDARYSAFGSYTPRPGASYERAPVATSMTRSRAVSRGGLGSSGRFFGGARS